MQIEGPKFQIGDVVLNLKNGRIGDIIDIFPDNEAPEHLNDNCMPMYKVLYPKEHLTHVIHPIAEWLDEEDLELLNEMTRILYQK